MKSDLPNKLFSVDKKRFYKGESTDDKLILDNVNSFEVISGVKVRSTKSLLNGCKK